MGFGRRRRCVEETGDELMGMSAVQSFTRTYPRGSMAAHVIGYMGKVYSETTLQEMKDKGYSTDALAGISGIESTMEDQLTSCLFYTSRPGRCDEMKFIHIQKEDAMRPLFVCTYLLLRSFSQGNGDIYLLAIALNDQGDSLANGCLLYTSRCV